MKPRFTVRRGSTLVTVLACTLVCGMVLVMMAKSGIRTAQLRRSLANRQQARTLISSAESLVRSRLASDNSYTGEAWHVAATDWQPGLPASITTEVTPGDAPGRKKIKLEVRLGPAENWQTQITRSFELNIRP